jgi:hypothetical protein
MNIVLNRNNFSEKTYHYTFSEHSKTSVIYAVRRIKFTIDENTIVQRKKTFSFEFDHSWRYGKIILSEISSESIRVKVRVIKKLTLRTREIDVENMILNFIQEYLEK